jgi:hypothetical protein
MFYSRERVINKIAIEPSVTKRSASHRNAKSAISQHEARAAFLIGPRDQILFPPTKEQFVPKTWTVFAKFAIKTRLDFA